MCVWVWFPADGLVGGEVWDSDTAARDTQFMQISYSNLQVHANILLNIRDDTV